MKNILIIAIILIRNRLTIIIALSTIIIFILPRCGNKNANNTNNTETGIKNSSQTHAGAHIELDSNDIDSVEIYYFPNYANDGGCDCSYCYSKDESSFICLKDRVVLDSIKSFVSELKPLSRDTVQVLSVIFCNIHYHNKRVIPLHFGFLWGTCFNGVKMYDDFKLQRFIKIKSGFYNAVHPEYLKSFRELNNRQ